MDRALVIHRGSLGDFLLLFPTLSSLRKKYRSAHIEVLGHPEILSLVCPGVADAIASVERASLVPFFEGFPAIPQQEENYLSSFDTVLAFLADPRHTLQRSLERLNVEKVVIRPPFPPSNLPLHVGRYLFETVTPLLVSGESNKRDGYSLASLGCLLQFENEEIQWARQFLMRGSMESPAIVAIHPGSGSEKKCWPVERFQTLIQRLRQEDCAIMLILGPADERLREQMIASESEPGCFIAESLPLRRLAALLSLCTVYVGNDSGVTHLAAVTGIPTIALFGPTDPCVWAPPGDHVKVIRANVQCGPCSREAMWDCLDRICMQNISVEEVALGLRCAMANSWQSEHKQP